MAKASKRIRSYWPQATAHVTFFELLLAKDIVIEAKPFALGVRVEHPQALIDQLQYKCEIRGPYLPPSPYSVVKQVDGRGVYSFCMCPGGIIARLRHESRRSSDQRLVAQQTRPKHGQFGYRG